MKPTCRYAYKVSKSGKQTLNRRHLCTPGCSWGLRESLAWFNRTPPLPGHPLQVQIAHRPCPAGTAYIKHWQSVPDSKGYLRGERFVDCGPKCGPCPVGHLASCDCLDCVTERITSDRRKSA